MAGKSPGIRIRTSSEKYGPVDFEIVGNIATQIDVTGEYFSPTRTFDASMKWVLDQINHMSREAPDLKFLN